MCGEACSEMVRDFRSSPVAAPLLRDKNSFRRRASPAAERESLNLPLMTALSVAAAPHLRGQLVGSRKIVKNFLPCGLPSGLPCGLPFYFPSNPNPTSARMRLSGELQIHRISGDVSKMRRSDSASSAREGARFMASDPRWESGQRFVSTRKRERRRPRN